MIPEKPEYTFDDNKEGNTTVKQVEINKQEKIAAVAFNVTVFPNPSSGEFRIRVAGNTNDPVTLRVMTVSGTTLEVRTALAKNGIFNIGSNLKGGTYFAEITQGANRQVVKLIKLN